jgi:hypothetical protein
LHQGFKIGRDVQLHSLYFVLLFPQYPIWLGSVTPAVSRLSRCVPLSRPGRKPNVPLPGGLLEVGSTPSGSGPRFIEP